MAPLLINSLASLLLDAACVSTNISINVLPGSVSYVGTPLNTSSIYFEVSSFISPLNNT